MSKLSSRRGYASGDHMDYIKAVLSLALGIVLVLPYTASAQGANNSAGNTDILSGRFWITVVAGFGLVGVIFAGVALFRLKKRLNGVRNMAIAAIITGIAAVAYAGWHLVTFVGDFGTGNGRAGAIFAIIFGLVSIALGTIALTRIRRSR